MINDDYPTCSKTFVTLRLYHAQAAPEEVTAKIKIAPTESQIAETRRLSGWFLSSADKVESKDTQRHLEWLLALLSGQDTVLHQLQAEGWQMDISCYWVSQNGHGGPTLSPAIMRRLSELQIEIWFDFYRAS